MVCYVQTVRSFSRALVLEVPWQRCLEGNKLGKPLYSICMFGRTLIRSVMIPSSLGPWNYSRSQSEWKKPVSVRWEGAATRIINMSQDLKPAKQIDGGERKSGGRDRQLNASASPERQSWERDKRKAWETFLRTESQFVEQISSFCTEHEGINRCKQVRILTWKNTLFKTIWIFLFLIVSWYMLDLVLRVPISVKSLT